MFIRQILIAALCCVVVPRVWAVSDAPIDPAVFKACFSAVGGLASAPSADVARLAKRLFGMKPAVAEAMLADPRYHDRFLELIEAAHWIHSPEGMAVAARANELLEQEQARLTRLAEANTRVILGLGPVEPLSVGIFSRPGWEEVIRAPEEKVEAIVRLWAAIRSQEKSPLAIFEEAASQVAATLPTGTPSHFKPNWSPLLMSRCQLVFKTESREELLNRLRLIARYRNMRLLAEDLLANVRQALGGRKFADPWVRSVEAKLRVEGYKPTQPGSNSVTELGRAILTGIHHGMAQGKFTSTHFVTDLDNLIDEKIAGIKSLSSRDRDNLKTLLTVYALTHFGFSGLPKDLAPGSPETLLKFQLASLKVESRNLVEAFVLERDKDRAAQPSPAKAVSSDPPAPDLPTRAERIATYQAEKQAKEGAEHENKEGEETAAKKEPENEPAQNERDGASTAPEIEPVLTEPELLAAMGERSLSPASSRILLKAYQQLSKREKRFVRSALSQLFTSPSGRLPEMKAGVWIKPLSKGHGEVFELRANSRGIKVRIYFGTDKDRGPLLISMHPKDDTSQQRDIDAAIDAWRTR